MTVAESQVKKLISGEASYRFRQLGFNMLLTRLSMNYKKNPSQATLRESTREVNSFLTKFAAIMKQDYEIISRL